MLCLWQEVAQEVIDNLRRENNAQNAEIISLADAIQAKEDEFGAAEGQLRKQLQEMAHETARLNELLATRYAIEWWIDPVLNPY